MSVGSSTSPSFCLQISARDFFPHLAMLMLIPSAGRGSEEGLYESLGHGWRPHVVHQDRIIKIYTLGALLQSTVLSQIRIPPFLTGGGGEMCGFYLEDGGVINCLLAIPPPEHYQA